MGPFPRSMWSFKTSGLSRQWSLKTGFTVFMMYLQCNPGSKSIPSQVQSGLHCDLILIFYQYRTGVQLLAILHIYIGLFQERPPFRGDLNSLMWLLHGENQVCLSLISTTEWVSEQSLAALVILQSHSDWNKVHAARWLDLGRRSCMYRCWCVSTGPVLG